MENARWVINNNNNKSENNSHNKDSQLFQKM